MVKSKNLSSPITSNTHQSLHNEPWTKKQTPFDYFLSLQEIAKHEVKTYDGFFPKPLLCEEARVYKR